MICMICAVNPLCNFNLHFSLCLPARAAGSVGPLYGERYTDTQREFEDDYIPCAMGVGGVQAAPKNPFVKTGI